MTTATELTLEQRREAIDALATTLLWQPGRVPMDQVKAALERNAHPSLTPQQARHWLGEYMGADSMLDDIARGCSTFFEVDPDKGGDEEGWHIAQDLKTTAMGVLLHGLNGGN